jgi:hypothetical protein
MPVRFPTAAALVLLAATAACDATTKGPARAESAAEEATPVPAPAGAARGDSARAGGAPAGPTGAGDAAVRELARNTPPFPAVRALYVNRFAALSAARRRYLIALADSTEVNALVIDGKDERGLAYVSENPEYNRMGGSEVKMKNVRALTDTLRAHGILPIARIVVFKDSNAARVHPEWTIRRPDGSVWRDHKGLAWVDPHNRALWEYNIGVAEELVRLGFAEVQFDYIRFPEPYKSLPRQIFPADKGQSKPDAIAEFLKVANGRLDALGVRTTADIFGLVTTVGGPLEVAQHWEKLSPITDVLLPMVYPSHYPPGSFGIRRPNAEPYRVVNVAISRARERDQRLGLAGRENVRPYLQAFSLGQPPYDHTHLAEQKRAVYDAGYDGWVLWHPGSKYEPFEAALERGELVSRKKAQPTTAPRVE